tara:strand:- start:761 stop:1018 length:258 start_codon:yes stop_codon:yes gene_type:complete
MRQCTVAKIAQHLTLLLFSPLFLFSIVGSLTAIVLDKVASVALVIPRSLIDWLQQYRADLVSSAHEIVSIDEIQNRIGTDINEDL